MNDISTQSLELHKKYKGKIQTALKFPVEDRAVMSQVYTPGVAAVSKFLHENPTRTNDYTWRGNLVAVISDGSAVLGLGNIGPEGAYPVMEGKCLLLKKLANIDAVPIVLNTQDTQEIINTIIAIAPSFGAINLEDIAAPRCFEIERALKEKLQMPVTHDDQWGTSVVVLAGLINAARAAGKNLKDMKLVINGAGAAGTAVAIIIHHYGVGELIVCDRNGAIYKARPGNSKSKENIASFTNSKNVIGSLKDAIAGADAVVGVSAPGSITEEMIGAMNKNPIVFALANPTPEIMPEQAKNAGAYIVATGRSDFPNQINNSLAFPGIFKGALKHSISHFSLEMFMNAAVALASLIENPTSEEIIPSVFDPRVVDAVAEAIL